MVNTEKNYPTHVAIIPDGNRRWAKMRGLPPLVGHKRGIQKLKETLEWAEEAGLKILSLWILSTENLNRSKEEIKGLFKFFETELVIHLRDEYINKHRIRVNFLGEITLLPPNLQKFIKEVEEKSKKYDERILNLFTAYGGRKEILNAVNTIIRKGLTSIDEDVFSQYLYTKGQPDPDLIIRTSGEFRTSGFMPWQSTYSEWYFSPKLWPDFTKDDFFAAIED